MDERTGYWRSIARAMATATIIGWAVRLAAIAFVAIALLLIGWFG